MTWPVATQRATADVFELTPTPASAGTEHIDGAAIVMRSASLVQLSGRCAEGILWAG